MLKGSPSARTLGIATALRDEASINVVIPMGGSGENFKEAGYSFPKPLIKIAGRPMLLHLLDSLKLRLGDVVWLVVPLALHLQYENEFDFTSELEGIDVRIVPFKLQTRGAVETLFIGLQYMSNAELSRKTICLDCDNLYFSDVIGNFRQLPRGQGCCFYFEDLGDAAIYSYLDMGDREGNRVLRVHEKSKVSNRANVGAYGFPSAALLRHFIKDVLDSKEKFPFRFFLSNIINGMIAAQHPFVAVEATEVALCGSPTKLEEFIDKVAAGKALNSPKRRFCFALDNVLVTAPEVRGNYRSVKPIEKNIQLVRELKESGHYIIITTSRQMQECGSNIGAVMATCGNVTLQTLAELGIPYDEIHFGQPHADLYVGRSVACSAIDTEKDLGWRVRTRAKELEPGMVAARHFNMVQLEGDCVIKTAARAVLRGEMYFYQHMPSDICDLFPVLVNCSEGRESERSESLSGESGDLTTPSAPSGTCVSSMTLQRIHGVTFSHLVTSRCLTSGRLQLLLEALRRLHSSEGDPERCPSEQLELCSNYLPKLQKRFDKYRELYLSLSPQSLAMFDRLSSFLRSYEEEGRYQESAVIHGDPVFSNVLLTEDSRIFLLDMRGELGQRLTLQGDLAYDLSKVYQSLLGYDFIILGQEMLERDAEILEELRETFRAFVADHYPGTLMSDVIKITASHYFGIVPLHVNQQHRLAYMHTCMALLSALPEEAE